MFEDPRIRLLKAPPYARPGWQEGLLMIVIFGVVLFLGLVS